MPSLPKRPAAAKPKPHARASLPGRLPQGAAGQRYDLHLYVTGTTPRSVQAIATIRSLCEELLPGRYDLEVVDIYQQPTAASSAQIIAAPTLVKTSPLPLRRLVGDLSDRTKLLAALNLHTRDNHRPRNGSTWIKV